MNEITQNYVKIVLTAVLVAGAINLAQANILNVFLFLNFYNLKRGNSIITKLFIEINTLKSKGHNTKTEMTCYVTVQIFI